MSVYFVSLTRDLIGAYLVFEAESDLAVRQYLEREYFRKNEWTLPWCSVYDRAPTHSPAIGRPILIKAQCGPLLEEQEPVVPIGFRL